MKTGFSRMEILHRKKPCSHYRDGFTVQGKICLILVFSTVQNFWAGPKILNMDLFKKDRALVSMHENSHFLFSGAHFMFPEKHFPRETNAKSIEKCNKRNYSL